MKVKLSISKVLFHIMILCIVSTVSAKEAPEPEYSTDVPDYVLTPGEVETRWAAFDSNEGMPSEQTVEKASTKKESFFDAFIDKEDGQFDVSDWLAKQYGFLPTPIIITGPTLGAGIGFNVLFLHDVFAGEKSESGRYIPPSMSGIAVAATENGTKFGGAYHIGFWKEDTIRSSTFIGTPDINLDFYPTIIGKERKVTMNLAGWQFYQELKFRLGESSWFIGANYLYVDVDSSAKDLPDPFPPELLTHQFTTASLGAVLEYDNRNSIFTPDSGTYAKASIINNNEAFGGDYDYMDYRFKVFHFLPVVSKVNLGLRAEARHVDGDAPYFFYPSIEIRGIATMRYQGQNTAVTEAEARWEVYPRWSLIGFVGTGKAFGEDILGRKTSFSDAGFETAGGVGFRYNLARKFRMQAGIDVAWGPEETAVYLTVGSAWDAFF